jgi:hypothetical protein
MQGCHPSESREKNQTCLPPEPLCNPVVEEREISLNASSLDRDPGEAGVDYPGWPSPRTLLSTRSLWPIIPHIATDKEKTTLAGAEGSHGRTAEERRRTRQVIHGCHEVQTDTPDLAFVSHFLLLLFLY